MIDQLVRAVRAFNHVPIAVEQPVAYLVTELHVRRSRCLERVHDTFGRAHQRFTLAVQRGLSVLEPNIPVADLSPFSLDPLEIRGALVDDARVSAVDFRAIPRRLRIRLEDLPL